MESKDTPIVSSGFSSPTFTQTHAQGTRFGRASSQSQLGGEHVRLEVRFTGETLDADEVSFFIQATDQSCGRAGPPPLQNWLRPKCALEEVEEPRVSGTIGASRKLMPLASPTTMLASQMREGCRSCRPLLSVRRMLN